MKHVIINFKSIRKLKRTTVFVIVMQCASAHKFISYVRVIYISISVVDLER